SFHYNWFINYTFLCCASRHYSYLVHFFFQAEDGIRYRNVTGVQTCALPISLSWETRTSTSSVSARLRPAARSARRTWRVTPASALLVSGWVLSRDGRLAELIGFASRCGVGVWLRNAGG